VRSVEIPKPKPSTYTRFTKCVTCKLSRINAAGHISLIRRTYSERDIHRRRLARIISHIIIFYTQVCVTCTYHQHGIILCLCRYIPVPAAQFRGYNYYYRQVSAVYVILLYALVSPLAVRPSANCY